MAQHNYCSQCGNPLSSTDKFCSKCGTEIANMESPGQNEESASEKSASEVGITGAFPRMLAYIPGLFWIPLAVDSKDKCNRKCANQGLLLLLYCIFVPAVFSIAGAILINVGVRSAADTSAFSVVPYQYQYQYPYQYPYQYTYPSPQTEYDNFGEFFNHFGEYFNNFGAAFNNFGTAYTPTHLKGTGLSNSIVGMLIGLLHALFILYIPINSIWGFIHCISHCEPHILPVIGKIKLIKYG